jgi:hypothetical protein
MQWLVLGTGRCGIHDILRIPMDVCQKGRGGGKGVQRLNPVIVQ